LGKNHILHLEFKLESNLLLSWWPNLGISDLQGLG